MARAELFAEELQVMKVLFQDYNRRNDFDALAGVEEDVNDILKTCSAREEDVRQTIKGLSAQVQELDLAAAYPFREGLHAERAAALQRQVDVTKHLIAELDQKSSSVEQQREELETQLQMTKTAAQEAAAKNTEEEGLLRYQLSMYAHITHVTWRLEQQDAVAGTVSDSKSGDIRTFNFDPKSVSEFELVNALWELL